MHWTTLLMSTLISTSIANISIEDYCTGLMGNFSQIYNVVSPNARLISIKTLQNNITPVIDQFFTEIRLLELPIYIYKQHALNKEAALALESEIANNLPSLNIVITDNLTVDPTDFHLFPKEGVTCVLFIISDANDPNSLLELEAFFHDLWTMKRLTNILVLIPACSPRQFVYFFTPFEGHDGRVQKVQWHQLKRHWFWNRATHLNMRGFEIRVAMFPRLPTAVKDVPPTFAGHPVYKQLNRSAYAGLDGIVLAEMAAHFNFSIVLVRSGGFGAVSQNGSYSGSWKVIWEKRADMAGNSRFMQPYDRRHFAFTSAVDCDALCVIVPKSDRIPDYAVIFHVFEKSVWAVIGGISVLSVAFWIFLRGKGTWSLAAILDMLPLFFAYPIRVKVYPPSRSFLAACLLYMVILNGIFNGSLMMSLSKTAYYPEINTLEEFDASGLPILTNLPIFSTDNSSIFRRLRKKVIVAQCTLAEVAFRRDVAVLERKRDARLPKFKFVGHNGAPLIHIVDECPVLKYLAYLVGADFPFLEQFNFVIGLLRNAGLLDKWYVDMVEGLIVDQRFQNKTQTDKRFSLSNAEVPFWLWLAAVCFAMIVFGIELMYDKWQQLNNDGTLLTHPCFDN